MHNECSVIGASYTSLQYELVRCSWASNGFSYLLETGTVHLSITLSICTALSSPAQDLCVACFRSHTASSDACRALQQPVSNSPDTLFAEKIRLSDYVVRAAHHACRAKSARSGGYM